LVEVVVVPELTALARVDPVVAVVVEVRILQIQFR
jgi:hypothetical protein